MTLGRCFRVCGRVFIRHWRSENSLATTQNSPPRFCLFPERALPLHNNPCQVLMETLVWWLWTTVDTYGNLKNTKQSKTFVTIVIEDYPMFTYWIENKKLHCFCQQRSKACNHLCGIQQCSTYCCCPVICFIDLKEYQWILLNPLPVPVYASKERLLFVIWRCPFIAVYLCKLSLVGIKKVAFHKVFS